MLQRARALVAVSTLETFGFTPAEAGAVGCPIVLSDIPAHREVAGGHARYVPVGDAGALRAAIETLPPRGTRRIWRWPVSWDDHARQLHGLLVSIAEHQWARAGT